jgi:hypothetical protein
MTNGKEFAGQVAIVSGGSGALRMWPQLFCFFAD